MSGEKMPNIADIRSEVAKIKNIVIEIYERPMVAKPVVELVIPTIYTPNIQVVPVDAPIKEIEEQRIEKKTKKKK